MEDININLTNLERIFKEYFSGYSYNSKEMTAEILLGMIAIELSLNLEYETDNIKNNFNRMQKPSDYYEYKFRLVEDERIRNRQNIADGLFYLAGELISPSDIDYIKNTLSKDFETRNAK